MSQIFSYPTGSIAPDIKTIVPDVGPNIMPDGAGTIAIVGGNNITTDGNVANTLTISVSGTTNHAVQVGDATGSLDSLAIGTNGQVLVGATGANPAFATLTSTDGTVTFTPGANTLDLSAAVANVPQDQIYYVGKHGNDLNSGRNIENAVLTFTQAIVLATAALPSAVNRFSIICLDDGIYAEALTVPQFVDIFAPSATLNGTLVVNDDSTIKFSQLFVADGAIGVLKTAGSSYTNVEIDTIDCDLSGIGVVGLAGFINVTWKEMYVQHGFGIGDASSAMGHMHIKGGDLYVTGTGIGIARANTGSTLGRVDHIADIGAGVGTGILVLDGSVDISVDTLNNSVAYNVNGAASVLRLFATTITGTRTVAAGGTAKTWIPPVAMTNGQLIIGSTGTDPVVASLTSTGGTVTITPGAGSINLEAAIGLTWSAKTVDAGLVVNTGTIANKVGLLTMTLPATAVLGDLLEFTNINTAVGLRIAQNANQAIRLSGSISTTGITGYVETTQLGDSLKLVCTVAGASTRWQALSIVGNWTIA